ncbi:MAG: F0F1 ATP synthase subunit A [Elusimicrobiota bacterium]|jgi:F-type H+-transporting ATPase subunit a
MNFAELLEHHILDHRIHYLFPIGTIPVYLTRHGLMMLIVAVLLIAVLGIARFQIKGGVPTGVANLIEVFIVYIRDEIVRPNLGDAGDSYLSYFCTLFFFILLCNLLGLVPYGATATGNISVTATLALTTFMMIHIAGIRKLGVWHYLKTYVPHGLPFWLVPLMFVIEVLGIFTKAFALCIRLFANMIAGHIVILAFLCLIFIMREIFHSSIVGVGVALGVSLPAVVGLGLLELFVAFLQAYIFTLLTAVFVGAAVNPQH